MAGNEAAKSDQLFLDEQRVLLAEPYSLEDIPPTYVAEDAEGDDQAIPQKVIAGALRKANAKLKQSLRVALGAEARKNCLCQV